MIKFQRKLQLEILKDFMDESMGHVDEINVLIKMLNRDPSDKKLLEELSMVLGSIYEGAFMLGRDGLMTEIDQVRELVLEMKKSTQDKGLSLYDKLIMSIAVLKQKIDNLSRESAEDNLAGAKIPGRDESKSQMELFQEVAEQHIKTVQEYLPMFTPSSDIIVVANILRAMKGIKGATLFIGHERLNLTAEKIENNLEDIIAGENGHGITSIIEEIKTLIWEIREFVNQWDDSSAQESTNGEKYRNDNGRGKIGDSPLQSNMKVNIKKVDGLMNSIGEMITLKMKILNLKQEITQDRMLTAYGKEMNGLAILFEKLTEQFYNQLLSLRMMPIRSLFRQFRKVIETLASEQDKQINVRIIGESTEIDRVVLESLKDPLVHLIRNAVDHGVDYPDERRRKGKNPAGSVWLKAFNDVNSVVIEIEDNGRGIDHNVIRNKAVEKGLVSMEKAQFMSKQEILDYIFMPGFSTAERVTEISGRGVGMDVVRTSIKKHGGTIKINTEKGRGTTFSIRLPLSLSMVDTLIVRAGSEMFAIPTDGIQRIMKIRKEQLKPILHKRVITYNGSIIPFRQLCDVMEISPQENHEDGTFLVAVVNGFNRKMAVGFDEIVGKQKIAIKTIGNYLRNIREIAGACIQGDGSVVLVINLQDMVKSAGS